MRYLALPALVAAALAAFMPGAVPAGSVKCATLNATIVGTNGADHIVGTPHLDVIAALGGNDWIKGNGGDDIICAGDGSDTVYGGKGWDGVTGGKGNDVLVGADGSDYLNGNAGNDRISGGNGHDAVFGGPGKDTVRGGNGPDDVRGDAGRDQLYGDAGADALKGGAGTDLCNGGADTDTASTARPSSASRSPRPRLAARAPVGEAGVVALRPRLDLRSAARTRPAGCRGRPSAGRGPCIAALVSARTRRSASSSTSRRRSHGERRARCSPSAFHLFPIPARALVEEGVAELARLIGCAEADDHRVEVGRVVHDVGAEPVDSGATAGQLEHRPVPQHRLELTAAQDEPRRARGRPPRRLHAPAALHAAGGCAGRGSRRR